MIELVISGGQTGADQGGWRAAKLSGIPTGGCMPRGFETEAGPRPELAKLYGAVETRECGKPLSKVEALKLRTWMNVRESDATIWFGDPNSPGARHTFKSCLDLDRPVFKVVSAATKPERVVEWLDSYGVRTLNVAGNRESSNPGIGDRVELFLMEVFRLTQQGSSDAR